MNESTKRSRVIRRVVIGSLVILTAIIAWRMTSLRGLPDIGDPFDVSEFTAPKVPDDENAFVLYREAVAKFRNYPPNDPPAFTWVALTPSGRSWLESNREGLAIWKRGTDRPRALNIPPGELVFESNLSVIQTIRTYVLLAGLEGSRHEAAGDFASAWEWYRAALRCSRHLGQRGTLIERLVGIATQRAASTRIRTWAANPKVDAKLLRRVLEEYQAIDRMTAPSSDYIKAEYITFVHTMDRPEMIWRCLEGFANPASTERGSRWKTTWLYVNSQLLREPERSRRVLRLLTANWLANCDLPASKRPSLLHTSKIAYAAGPSPAWNAHIISDESLTAWFDSTIFVKTLFAAYHAGQTAIDRERVFYNTTVLQLARLLYERETGEEPESDEELVGPYLKALPEPAITPDK